MLSNFDFDDEYFKLRSKYPSVTVERSEFFYSFLTNDHSDQAFKIFLRSLSGDEYFFVFDSLYLLHKRCLERLHNTFNT